MAVTHGEAVAAPLHPLQCNSTCSCALVQAVREAAGAVHAAMKSSVSERSAVEASAVAGTALDAAPIDAAGVGVDGASVPADRSVFDTASSGAAPLVSVPSLLLPQLQLTMSVLPESEAPPALLHAVLALQGRSHALFPAHVPVVQTLVHDACTPVCVPPARTPPLSSVHGAAAPAAAASSAGAAAATGAVTSTAASAAAPTIAVALTVEVPAGADRPANAETVPAGGSTLLPTVASATGLPGADVAATAVAADAEVPAAQFAATAPTAASSAACCAPSSAEAPVLGAGQSAASTAAPVLPAVASVTLPHVDAVATAGAAAQRVSHLPVICPAATAAVPASRSPSAASSGAPGSTVAAVLFTASPLHPEPPLASLPRPPASLASRVLALSPPTAAGGVQAPAAHIRYPGRMLRSRTPDDGALPAAALLPRPPPSAQGQVRPTSADSGRGGGRHAGLRRALLHTPREREGEHAAREAEAVAPPPMRQRQLHPQRPPPRSGGYTPATPQHPVARAQPALPRAESGAPVTPQSRRPVPPPRRRILAPVASAASDGQQLDFLAFAASPAGVHAADAQATGAQPASLRQSGSEDAVDKGLHAAISPVPHRPLVARRLAYAPNQSS